MPIRNPFRKQDENVRPISTDVAKANAVGSPIHVPHEKDQVEYKLSEINDSGVYLPPSPQEKKSFWGGTTISRSTTSTTSSSTRNNHRCLLNENEQFNISRESFESYRRSFDISARSPVIQPAESRQSRASLDSAFFRSPPRSSASFTRPLPPTSLPERRKEEELEDVSLDEPSTLPQPRKKGLFSRIIDSGEHAERPVSSGAGGAGGGAWHHFGSGRKRGQSGTGQELGTFPKPSEDIKRDQTPKPESQAQQPPTAANGTASENQVS